MLRRDFIKVLAAATALPSFAMGKSSSADPNRIVIFSDTHVHPDGYQTDAFAARIKTLLAMDPLPAHLLLYGDFAYLFGKEEDYKTLRPFMEQVEKAGIQWDLSFGNHDRREAFFKIFPERVQEKPNVPGKYVSIVKTQYADFIMLDSLVEGKVPGAVDDTQKKWLADTLKGYSKPVFTGSHHPLHEVGIADILNSSKWSAGYIHGHNHYWKTSVESNIQTLCLPSTGHWGDIGYTVLDLSEKEAVFSLKMLDFYYPKPAESPRPEWIAEIEKKTGSTFKVSLPVK
ncbi:MAG: metallophosphoesterase [Planctomycetia bacterium]|nr:metallophosphoesterase [Planctomycetia bacterium]